MEKIDYTKYSNQDFELHLKNKFPLLFKYLHEKYNISISYGLEINKGWFNLIDELSEQLSKLDSNIYFVQIKQKFGSLRAYIQSESDSIFEKANLIISSFEDKSQLICENCGENGVMINKKGWITVSCKNCEKKSFC